MKRATSIKFALAGSGVLLVVIILLVNVAVPLVSVNSPTPTVATSNNVGSASAGSQGSTSSADADQRVSVSSVPIQAGIGGEVSTNPGVAVHGALSSQPPVLDAKTLARQQSEANEEEQQADPLTPLDKNPVVKTLKPESAPVDAPQQTQVFTNQATLNSIAAPADFYIYETKDLGGGASLIGEASHASNSFAVLETYNWGTGLSVDGGRTFKYLNPYTMFPASYGGFCCDQVAYYDQAHDIMFWVLQYSTDAGSNNAIRLAWANGFGNLVAANFCYVDLTPQQLGSPTGTNYDQPKFARSDNNIYLEMTQYGAAGGSIVIRVAVSSFTSACGGIGYQWYSPGLFSPGFTQRAYGTMYFAAHVSNSTLRVFAWPESAANWTGITTHDVAHTAYPLNYPYTCARTGGSSTSDWCQRRSFGGGWAHSDRIFSGWLTGGNIFFSWDASQGNNGVGGPTFAYPYLHIVRVRESDFALLSEPIVYSSGFAIQYASAALNDRLNVAGTVMWGGGSYYENCALFIWDDLSPGYTVGSFGWEWYNATGSNVDPTDKLSGDYFAARRNAINGNTWSGSCYNIRNDGSGGAVNVHPYYFWFGRGRDYTYLRDVFVPAVLH